MLDKFGCSTVAELRRNKTFSMSMAGEVISLKSKEDWMRLYRRWVGVPDSERNKSGSTCINGIDVLGPGMYLDLIPRLQLRMT